MIENELKFKVDDLDRIEEKLKALGASLKNSALQVDYYFSHPCKDFLHTDEALRVRVMDKFIEVTYKGPRRKNSVKSREEINIRFSKNDFKNILRLLQRLGFKKYFIIEKYRKEYSLNDFNICLDDVKGLGKFVEIELLGDSRNIMDRIIKLVRKLDIEFRPIEKTYLELFKTLSH